MARTIGTKLIKKIHKLIDESGLEGCNETLQYIKEQLPLEVFGIWEGAYNEIQNIVWDYMMSDQYKSKRGKIMDKKTKGKTDQEKPKYELLKWYVINTNKYPQLSTKYDLTEVFLLTESKNKLAVLAFECIKWTINTVLKTRVCTDRKYIWFKANNVGIIDETIDLIFFEEEKKRMEGLGYKDTKKGWVKKKPMSKKREKK